MSGTSLEPVPDIPVTALPNPARPLANTHLDELLRVALRHKASHLHIAVGLPPVYRVGGKLLQASYTVFTPPIARRIVYGVLSSEQRRAFESSQELEFLYSSVPAACFRGNVYYDRGAIAASFLCCPYAPPLAGLQLAPVLQSLTEARRGLILVTGPSSSGKTTTLAAMVEAINRSRSEHIVVLEEESEYFYRHQRSIIHQRKLDADPASLGSALRRIADADPNVLLMPPPRDLRSIRRMLDYAEQHLVFSSIASVSAATTVSRLIEAFAEPEQAKVREQVADTLNAVICQQLVPTADGKRRVCTQEVMVMTPEIRDRIRAREIDAIQSILERSAEQGMQTMDQSLVALYAAGTISREMVLMRSMHRTTMEEMIRKREEAHSSENSITVLSSPGGSS